jgi:hypothetical protein
MIGADRGAVAAGCAVIGRALVLVDARGFAVCSATYNEPRVPADAVVVYRRRVFIDASVARISCAIGDRCRITCIERSAARLRASARRVTLGAAASPSTSGRSASAAISTRIDHQAACADAGDAIEREAGAAGTAVSGRGSRLVDADRSGIATILAMVRAAFVLIGTCRIPGATRAVNVGGVTA